jgi:hypothetical protein
MYAIQMIWKIQCIDRNERRQMCPPFLRRASTFTRCPLCVQRVSIFIRCPSFVRHPLTSSKCPSSVWCPLCVWRPLFVRHSWPSIWRVWTFVRLVLSITVPVNVRPSDSIRVIPFDVCQLQSVRYSLVSVNVFPFDSVRCSLAFVWRLLTFVCLVSSINLHMFGSMCSMSIVFHVTSGNVQFHCSCFHLMVVRLVPWWTSNTRWTSDGSWQMSDKRWTLDENWWTTNGRWPMVDTRQMSDGRSQRRTIDERS